MNVEERGSAGVRLHGVGPREVRSGEQGETSQGTGADVCCLTLCMVLSSL